MNDIVPIQTGSVVDGFIILQRIGYDVYGEIYCVQEEKTKSYYAMKVEKTRSNKSYLRLENSIYKRLSKTNLFPSYHTYKENIIDKYIVMELLGPSLSAIRKYLPGGRFGLSTLIQTGIRMLRCLEEFHNCGLIHRDIKPSNFLFRPGSPDFLALIDYGLSKLYIDPETNKIIPQSHKKSFKGTIKYASIRAHCLEDQSKRDDLHSWFFSFIELYMGRLPWSSITEKTNIEVTKINWVDMEMSNKLPTQFIKIYREIDKLGFTDTPNYENYVQELINFAKTNNIDLKEKLEWIEFDETIQQQISALPFSGGEPFNNGRKDLLILPSSLVNSGGNVYNSSQRKLHVSPNANSSNKTKTCLIL